MTRLALILCLSLAGCVPLRSLFPPVEPVPGPEAEADTDTAEPEDAGTPDVEPETDPEPPEAAMAIVQLAPDAIVSSVNMTGDINTINDDPFAPDGTFMVPTDPTQDSELVVSFPTPPAPLDTSILFQKFVVFGREVGAGGFGPNFTFTINNDGLPPTQTSGLNTFDSAGSLEEFQWGGSLAVPADGSAIQLRLAINNQSSQSIEIDAVAWLAATTDIDVAGTDFELVAPGADYSLVMP